MRDEHCRHCGHRIHAVRGTWIHFGTGSAYCDLSGTSRAAPR